MTDSMQSFSLSSVLCLSFLFFLLTRRNQMNDIWHSGCLERKKIGCSIWLLLLLLICELINAMRLVDKCEHAHSTTFNKLHRPNKIREIAKLFIILLSKKCVNCSKMTKRFDEKKRLDRLFWNGHTEYVEMIEKHAQTHTNMKQFFGIKYTHTLLEFSRCMHTSCKHSSCTHSMK